VSSGDARYYTIGESLRSIDTWRREHDEAGGVPSVRLRELELTVKAEIPPILDADAQLRERGLRKHFVKPSSSN